MQSFQEVSMIQIKLNLYHQPGRPPGGIVTLGSQIEDGAVATDNGIDLLDIVRLIRLEARTMQFVASAHAKPLPLFQ